MLRARAKGRDTKQLGLRLCVGIVWLLLPGQRLIIIKQLWLMLVTGVSPAGLVQCISSSLAIHYFVLVPLLIVLPCWVWWTRCGQVFNILRTPPCQGAHCNTTRAFLKWKIQWTHCSLAHGIKLEIWIKSCCVTSKIWIHPQCAHFMLHSHPSGTHISAHIHQATVPYPWKLMTSKNMRSSFTLTHKSVMASLTLTFSLITITFKAKISDSLHY